MGDVLLSCAKVREPIELSFGAVSGVGLGIRVLDGSPRVSRRRSGFRGFSPALV